MLSSVVVMGLSLSRPDYCLSVVLGVDVELVVSRRGDLIVEGWGWRLLSFGSWGGDVAL